MQLTYRNVVSFIMRIGLLDADLMDNGTRHPNLALMKIAGFYRDQGHEVQLIFDNYMSVYDFDKVFISKVFTFSKIPDWVLSLDCVSIGGTGFFEDGGPNLPDEIEHHMPYYDLYKEYVDHQLALGHKRTHYADYLDYSIGFTTRGCFRKCEFCVNKKYDHAFRHSPVSEFLDESRPYIYLWDDNILALPEWESVLDDIEAANRPFQFRQGIDLRLMTDQKAKRFVASHYQGDFIFAFDHIEDKEIIIQKVQLWKRYTAKVCKMYVIAAYKSQDAANVADVFERIHTLMKYGSIPYLMRYEAYKTSELKHIYIELARWCNQPNFFKKMSFREFCVANQNYKKDQSSNCSAYQALLDFEASYPDIAAKYFDLRFDQESIYLTQYGYGRRYANKPRCADCKKRGLCWDAFLYGEHPADKMLSAYFTKEIDLECLRYANAECTCNSREAAEFLAEAIKNTSVKDILALLRRCPDREPVTKENIPQYSDPDAALFRVVKILRGANASMSFEELGYYLKRDDPTLTQNTVSNKKYGENHAKLAALLDLVLIDKADARAHISLSEFGTYFSQLSEAAQDELIYKLCLRIPIVQNCLIADCPSEALVKNLEILSKETQKRRRRNVEDVINLVSERGGLHQGG